VLNFNGGQTNPYTLLRKLPPTTKAAHVHITKGPAPELANSNSAIIRGPAITREYRRHFGVVTYGTDPKNLNDDARNHIRLNRNHPYTYSACVSMACNPGRLITTRSIRWNGDGARDGVKSPVRHFTTR